MGERPAAARPLGRPLVEAALVAAGMAVFAILGNFEASSGLPAAAGLVLAAVAFYLSLRTGSHPATLFGFAPLPRRTWPLAAVGALLGVVLGVGYRYAWRPTLWPGDLSHFVFVATVIGAAEEVLYRGYVQGRLTSALDGRSAAARVLAPVAAIVLAAGAHTAYKAALFVSPPEGVVIDYGFLVTWTVVGGVAFGALRAWAGNVWPALAAHVVFDLLAYGDAARAPWWVWG
jgi:membrane protease YdiL (CAAX protease family)